MITAVAVKSAVTLCMISSWLWSSSDTSRGSADELLDARSLEQGSYQGELGD